VVFNIYDLARVAADRVLANFSRVGDRSAQVDDFAEEMAWQKADCKWLLFDFKTYCLAFLFVLFLILCY
jgi:hypothetical protein